MGRPPSGRRSNPPGYSTWEVKSSSVCLLFPLLLGPSLLSDSYWSKSTGSEGSRLRLSWSGVVYSSLRLRGCWRSSSCSTFWDLCVVPYQNLGSPKSATLFYRRALIPSFKLQTRHGRAEAQVLLRAGRHALSCQLVPREREH